MYHNGGFPSIYEGGQKEVIQREFSSKNILPLSQIFNTSSQREIKLNRTQPIVYNVVDNKPVFNKKKNK